LGLVLLPYVVILVLVIWLVVVSRRLRRMERELEKRLKVWELR